MDPDKAIGKPHSLWCAFAKFYERHGDVPNARIIFQKATEVGKAPSRRFCDARRAAYRVAGGHATHEQLRGACGSRPQLHGTFYHTPGLRKPQAGSDGP